MRLHFLGSFGTNVKCNKINGVDPPLEFDNIEPRIGGLEHLEGEGGKQSVFGLIYIAILYRRQLAPVKFIVFIFFSSQTIKQ